nr:hypothetical protein [Tanacetum cinerariifolium]
MRSNSRMSSSTESHRVVTDLQTLGYRYANSRTIDGQLVVVVALMVTWVAGGVKYVIAGPRNRFKFLLWLHFSGKNIDQVMFITQLKYVNYRLAGALRAHDAARNLEPLMGNGGNRNRRNGNGNRNVGGNGYNFRGFMPARECTYQDFMKYQPISFNRTKGVVGLTRWFEKMETAFHISNCPEKYQELVLLCTRMVPNEEEKFERFVKGLLDNIQGNIIAAKPTKIQDEIRIANNLMDQKLKGYARSAENQRMLENNPRDNHGQQLVFKQQNVGGQNVARAYTTENNDKKGYVGSLSYCNKCKLHHALSCTVRYGNCKRVGHMTRDCKVTITLNTQRAPVGNHPGFVYYECGRLGY